MEWDSDSLSLAGILAFRGNFSACSLSPCALGAARPPRRPLTGPLPAGRCWLLSHRGGHSWASHSWCLAVQLYAGIVFIMQQAPARCTPSRRYLQPPSCKKKNTSPTLKPSLLPSPALLRQPSLCLINPMACRAPPAKHAHTHRSPRMQARSRAEITAPARTAVAAERLLPLRPSKSGSCLGFQGPGSSVSPPRPAPCVTGPGHHSRTITADSWRRWERTQPRQVWRSGTVQMERYPASPARTEILLLALSAASVLLLFRGFS